MSEKKIETGDLVGVVMPDRDLRCWGLVITEFPSGVSFGVQIGSGEHDNVICKPENLTFFAHTDGKFTNPQDALAYHRDQILLDAALNSITSKELRALQRLKRRLENRKKERFLGGIGRLLHRVRPAKPQTET